MALQSRFFANDKAIAAGGAEVIKFHAIAAGGKRDETYIPLILRANIPPLKTFEITVIIKK